MIPMNRDTRMKMKPLDCRVLLQSEVPVLPVSQSYRIALTIAHRTMNGGFSHFYVFQFRISSFTFYFSLH